jgi:phosphocarrier protein
MLKKTLKVINKYGIHARPAERIVDIAGKSKSAVDMFYQGTKANAKSIINVMMLAVEPGADVEFVVNGSDEQETMDALEKLFNDRFDEDSYA